MLFKELKPVIKRFRQCYQPFNKRYEVGVSKEGQIVNRVDSQVLMTSDELEIFEEASMIMILIAGENPT